MLHSMYMRIGKGEEEITVQDIVKKTRWHIVHYWEIKKAISMARADKKRRRGERIGGVQTDNNFSDPTGFEAIANLMPINYVRVPGYGIVDQPEVWIKAIDAGLSACSEEVRDTAVQSFWSRKSWKYITIKAGIDKKTFYRRRDMAVSAVAVAAAQYGLLNIEEDGYGKH